MKKLLILISLLLVSWTPLIATDALSPKGQWKTIDDKTGNNKSIVEIWIDNGELKGKVIELINPEEPNQKCDDCKGDRKGQPIVGMQFIWGLTEEDGIWDGGEILDPDNGKIYRGKISVSEDGQKLNVRGYIGFALLGRTQVWERVSEG
ncbi:MAG: DUF2147 domain-containing protein [Opitutaceae bacterium]|nr:DUF2147 domain-containing protein [Opitutaceae bacterium]